MTADRSLDHLQRLVLELGKLPRETEWVEFKVDDARPPEIGEYVSALANSAALLGKEHGYLVWGIEDTSHAVVGTRFDPAATKVGNEELENWLSHLLTPKLQFRFFPFDLDGARVVLLEIERAFRQPVQFQGQEFIRVGSYKKRLKDHPEKERALWKVFDSTPFEDRLALERVSDQEVLRLLDYPAYFHLLSLPLPSGPPGILLTNTSLRARFGIAEGNAATASRLIKEAVEAGAIAPFDAGAAPKLMKYVPWWAKPAGEGT